MKMDYCVHGTNNMEASIAFYDSLFEQTELNKVLSTDRMTFWQGKDFAFAIAIPFNQAPASNGNGTMIGFNVGSIEEVKWLHKKAIELGGSCEGEPNQRGPKFSAYVRDLDKNKIVFFSVRILDSSQD
ncbi:MAG: putative lactoylglutathione lyase [Marinomonas primoryensis]|jgi:predicted lactoylglutathione lyase